MTCWHAVQRRLAFSMLLLSPCCLHTCLHTFLTLPLPLTMRLWVRRRCTLLFSVSLLSPAGGRWFGKTEGVVLSCAVLGLRWHCWVPTTPIYPAAPAATSLCLLPVTCLPTLRCWRQRKPLLHLCGMNQFSCLLLLQWGYLPHLPALPAHTPTCYTCLCVGKSGAVHAAPVERRENLCPTLIFFSLPSLHGPFLLYTWACSCSTCWILPGTEEETYSAGGFMPAWLL